MEGDEVRRVWRSAVHPDDYIVQLNISFDAKFAAELPVSSDPKARHCYQLCFAHVDWDVGTDCWRRCRRAGFANAVKLFQPLYG